MLTYTYICEGCKHEIDIEQSIKDDALSELQCTECGSKLHRSISGLGNFVLKGNCWAKDSYSSKKKK
jgi:putative FmdB family regulatory protein